MAVAAKRKSHVIIVTADLERSNSRLQTFDGWYISYEHIQGTNYH